jgi:hypothetical protein
MYIMDGILTQITAIDSIYEYNPKLPSEKSIRLVRKIKNARIFHINTNYNGKVYIVGGISNDTIREGSLYKWIDNNSDRAARTDNII